MPIQSVMLGFPFQAQVAARLPGGATDTSYNGPLTIRLLDPGYGAALNGVLTQTAVAGVATFPGLQLNKVGANFRLAGVAPGYLEVESNPFSVVVPGGPPAGFLYLPIPADALNGLNIRSRFVTAFGNSPTDGNYPTGLRLWVEVLEGVTVASAGSTGNFDPAKAPAPFRFDQFAAGWATNHTIVLQNRGYIFGAAGRGGMSSTIPVNFPARAIGEDGGDAISLDGLNVIIINEEGYIFGGGGGGGAGGAARAAGTASYPGPSDPNQTTIDVNVAGGGGGAGAGSGNAAGGITGSANRAGSPSIGSATGALSFPAGTAGTAPVCTPNIPANSAGSKSCTYNFTLYASGSMSVARSVAGDLYGEVGGYTGITGTPGDGADGSVATGSGTAGPGSLFVGSTFTVNGSASAGKGGRGGDWAENGEPGETGVASGSGATVSATYAGGTAGKAIALAGGAATVISGDSAERLKGIIA